MKKFVLYGFVIASAIILSVLSVVLLFDNGTEQNPMSSHDDDAGANVAPSGPESGSGAAATSGAFNGGKPVATPIPDDQTAMATPPPATSDAEFTPLEQATVDAIQNALDNEDFKKLAAQLKNAAASKNPAVRGRAVEALRWFGKKALPELTLFMADEDEDVQSSAVDAWTMGLSEMEAGEAKARAIKLGLSAVSDKDQLESMVMQVDDLTDSQKLEVLSQTIEGNNKTAAEVAREHYKFWTDEDYTDPAAAQRWLSTNAADEN